MQGSKFKQALLESLLVGLQRRGVASTSEIGFHERKRAIRFAADAALVNARGPDATRWSRTMQAAAEPAHRRQITRPCAKTSALASSKRMFRRFHRLRRPRKVASATACSSAGILAMAMVRKRMRVLKGIVPGGKELHDECKLLGEALDYAVCLKAQVDVMQLLVRVLQAAKP